ncbi:hypothetical protein EPUS_08720 [Endocarpon pusillum Z07020]|uniref:Uncharacterized protein n=1 Tax=Endocarpon pusillum (strain Z07020 / HMAS-L-300199) TaxID=1263415 RepID=U1GWY6_ENDPU|nr:uncharacterized protein EPUS_08720 [Endocarpon pusillum Z07020]ERF76601.1 hypothetical protein EPUS_08720 [Endocarpon pusillum Z07020]
MASVNRITSSAAAAYLELAPSLANVNFDFALYKVEAPKEFQAVGQALSSLRREEAESGASHKTARKLGALFDRLIPSTPELLKAYGLRASEIIRSMAINSKESSEFGFFANRIGADATSIWAAATSGSAAIAVHLLACMLARIWEGPEATTIWYELVQKQKEQIGVEIEHNNFGDFGAFLAAQQELSRSQLRDWDASARAWLRVADEAKRKEQTQVRLIVDNIQKTEVNTKVTVYDSVLEAWRSCLNQMNCVVKGTPQQAEAGATLLGLSSWHLYPDMIAMGPCLARPAEVRHNDPLIAPGGILTLGLEMSSGGKDVGVTWSLPLAYLRYYGQPVIASGSIDTAEKSRITLEELMAAVLGVITQDWISRSSALKSSLELLACFSELLKESALKGNLKAQSIMHLEGGHSWLILLLNTAKNFAVLNGSELQTVKKLLHLGATHGSAFLGRPLCPLFGMLNPETYMGMLEVEDRIHLLREIAKQLPYKPHQIFIRYKHDYPAWNKDTFEFTTALPLARETCKRDLEERVKESQGHRRWIHTGASSQPPLDTSSLIESGVMMPYDETSNEFVELEDIWHDRFTEVELAAIIKDYPVRASYYSSLGEGVFRLEDEQIYMGSAQLITWQFPASEVSGTLKSGFDFKFMLGDPRTAALFVKNRDIRSSADNSQLSDVGLRCLPKLFQAKKVNCDTFVDALCVSIGSLYTHDNDHLMSLKAFSAAAILYNKLRNATVDVRVLRQPLKNAQWRISSERRLTTNDANDHDFLEPGGLEPATRNNLMSISLDRSETFACICMFESGRFNVEPHRIKNTVAISSVDSLFIAAPLLHDPASLTGHSEVERVTGNVGRAGVAFLVLPDKPMVKSQDLDVWNMINHEDYDSQRIDCFASTTLHLSFTGSVVPIDVGVASARDMEIYILESVVSVHDRGKWVADLNVTWDYGQWVYASKPCRHGEGNATNLPLTSIDSWAELIDKPLKHAVVRAHNNWQARLAATSICLFRRQPVRILPSAGICWRCWTKRYAHANAIIFVD